MDSPVSITYSLSKIDYVNAVYLSLFKTNSIPRESFSFVLRLIKSSIFSSVFSTFLLAVLNIGVSISGELDFRLSILLFVLPVMLAEYLFNKRYVAKRIVRRKLKHGEIDECFFGQHLLEFSQFGICLQCNGLIYECFYSDIERIEIYNECLLIYIYHLNLDFIIVPNSAFSDELHRCSFLHALKLIDNM